MWSVPRCYKKGARLEFKESVKRELEGVQLKNLHLEAVARERLVKTQEVGKSLAGTVVICELWRSTVAL
jgi:hypothetical protein